MDPVKERGFYHEAVSKTASTYRCGGDVPGLRVDSAGRGARVDTDE
jgi:hypothetical protein